MTFTSQSTFFKLIKKYNFQIEFLFIAFFSFICFFLLCSDHISMFWVGIIIGLNMIYILVEMVIDHYPIRCQKFENDCDCVCVWKCDFLFRQFDTEVCSVIDTKLFDSYEIMVTRERWSTSTSNICCQPFSLHRIFFFLHVHGFFIEQ